LVEKVEENMSSIQQMFLSDTSDEISGKKNTETLSEPKALYEVLSCTEGGII
jgi:hypothetical protein